MASKCCSICELEAQQYLIQCQTCNQWLCNQRQKDDDYSHATDHMKKHKHVNYIYPHNQLGNHNPQCIVCGTTNAARLSFLAHHKEYIVVCHLDECLHDDRMKEYNTDHIKRFITKKQFSTLLAPIPNEKIVQEDDELKKIQKQTDHANNNYNIQQQQRNLDNAAFQQIQEQSIEQQIKDIENQVLFVPKLPNRYNVKNKEIFLINNYPYSYLRFEKYITSKKIQYDEQTQELTSNDGALQRKIDKYHNQKVDYAKLNEMCLDIEETYSVLQNQTQKLKIETCQVYMRKKNTQSYEFIFPWDRFATTTNKKITIGNFLILNIIDVESKTYEVECIVKSTIDYLVLQLSEQPPTHLFKKFRDADTIEIDNVKFTEVPKESALANISILKGYDAWKFAENDTQIEMQFKQVNTVYQRVRKLFQHDITQGNQLLNLIMGVDDGDILKQFSKYSKEVIPKVDVNELMGTIKNYIAQCELFSPNEVQENAIRHVMQNCITLIQGCPGGGKTFVASYITYGLTQLYKKGNRNGKILCCTGSNIASDNIAIFCNRMKLNAIRVYASYLNDPLYDFKKSEQINQIDLRQIIIRNCESDIYINNKLLNKRESDALYEYLKSPETYQDYLKENQIEFEIETIKAKIEEYEIKNTDVVICTCCTAGDQRLQKVQFDAVILDEASQSIELEHLIAIVHTNQHIVIIGDQNQLGPVLSMKQLQKAHFSRSIYQRLLNMGIKPKSLNIQYRMHQGLLEFPNRTFYGDAIRPGIEDETCLLKINRQLPNGIARFIKPNFPSMFIHTTGSEIQEMKSYKNEVECAMVMQVLRTIFIEYKGLKYSDIGIITPYAAQQNFILKEIQQISDKIEVNSVDGFQGREMEVIIMSTVRSNEEGELGFLHDKKRLNVSITRAKKMLIIIGNGIILTRNENWNQLFQFYTNKDAVFYGNSVSDLTLFKSAQNQK